MILATKRYSHDMTWLLLPESQILRWCHRDRKPARDEGEQCGQPSCIGLARVQWGSPTEGRAGHVS